MLEVAAILFLLFAILVVWFVKGLVNDRNSERLKQVDNLHRVLDENAEADNATSGSDLDKRVRDKYGDR